VFPDKKPKPVNASIAKDSIKSKTPLAAIMPAGNH
jgi:hypothetical protein